MMIRGEWAGFPMPEWPKQGVASPKARRQTNRIRPGQTKAGGVRPPMGERHRPRTRPLVAGDGAKDGTPMGAGGKHLLATISTITGPRG